MLLVMRHYDIHAEARQAQPTMVATTTLPAEEIGETAVDLLAERVAGREIAKRVTLATKVIWRASTRRPSPIRRC